MSTRVLAGSEFRNKYEGCKKLEALEDRLAIKWAVEKVFEPISEDGSYGL